jgi:hypothetical protein
MTVTIAGRCTRTNQAGLASATVSLAVGRLFEIYETYSLGSDLRDTGPARTPPMAAFWAEALRRGGAFGAPPSCVR